MWELRRIEMCTDIGGYKLWSRCRQTWKDAKVRWRGRMQIYKDMKILMYEASEETDAREHGWKNVCKYLGRCVSKVKMHIHKDNLRWGFQSTWDEENCVKASEDADVRGRRRIAKCYVREERCVGIETTTNGGIQEKRKFEGKDVYRHERIQISHN